MQSRFCACFARCVGSANCSGSFIGRDKFRALVDSACAGTQHCAHFDKKYACVCEGEVSDSSPPVP